MWWENGQYDRSRIGRILCYRLGQEKHYLFAGWMILVLVQYRGWMYLLRILFCLSASFEIAFGGVLCRLLWIWLDVCWLRMLLGRAMMRSAHGEWHGRRSRGLGWNWQYDRNLPVRFYTWRIWWCYLRDVVAACLAGHEEGHEEQNQNHVNFSLCIRMLVCLGICRGMYVILLFSLC